MRNVTSREHRPQGPVSAAKIACILLVLTMALPYPMAATVTASNGGPAIFATPGDPGRSLENQSYSIGLQAYVYGLAPVIMQRTEEQFTTTPGPGHAPVNQFGHITRLATPEDTDVVTPNADTLYSTAWLELGKEPVILQVPDTGDRYYVMQMLDAYTNNFASVGRRTTGTGEGSFAIVGPRWNGSLPANLTVIESPTNTVWIIGRILVNGYDDLSNATALQSQFTLTPLSRLRNQTTPAQNLTLADYKQYTPSPNVQERLRFFEELRVAMLNNPPPPGEETLMANFSRIGLMQAQSPYGTGLNPEIGDGLARAIVEGDRIVGEAWANQSGKGGNTWLMNTKTGNYGSDYLTRAAVAAGGLGANVPEEAVYARAMTSIEGAPLNGADRYVIRFGSGNLPPVDAFWSLSAYNASTYMLASNPYYRYSIGDQTPGLKYNPDGSLDIYIQKEIPEGKESNWLPAPEGNFYLILRMYEPGSQVLDGTYQIPPVRRA
ncbi:DUF1254 domain-containing protein [Methanocella sp. MCL-LM]|uniref:DUF1254 domain-containing protein n=1 Tax=Methanocella sp. MCL-LM TaxID=3412035 RepID=UPI003C73FF6D